MAIQVSLGRVFYFAVLAVCLGVMGCSTGGPSAQQSSPAPAKEDSIYAFKMKTIDGWPVPLSRYEGQVLLVVNVASECRFTDQYRNLQRLYMKYRDRGFVVLGFPSNDFGRQEPGSDAEIKEFTRRQFNVMFPLFSKISVAGEDIHPLYQCLTRRDNNGEFGGPITWNFNKFLVDRDGTIIARFASEVDPLDPQVTEAIEAALD